MGHPIHQAFSLSQVVSRTVGLRLLHDEAVIRALLGRWVSELEPAVAYNREGDVIGLTIAGAPLGSSPFLLPAERPGIPEAAFRKYERMAAIFAENPVRVFAWPSWAGPGDPPRSLSPDVPGTKGDMKRWE